MSRNDDIENDRARNTRIDAPLRWPWIVSTVVLFLLSIILFTLLIRGRDSKDQSGQDGNSTLEEQTNIQKAQLECDIWEKAVNTYAAMNPGFKYPTTLKDPNVVKYILDGANKLKDPWGNMYQLEMRDDSSGGQIPVVFTIHPRTGQRLTKRGLNK